MLLSVQAVSQGNKDTPIVANPQIINYGNPVFPIDTVNWIKVSGIYTAAGGEKFLTIGNFKRDEQTDTVNTNFPTGVKYGEYYIDDVSVFPLDSIVLKADAGKDTTVTIGDSVFIGSLTNGITNIKWYNDAGQVIDTARPGFNVAPTINTFYVMEQVVCGQYSRDTVNVTVQAMPLKLLAFTAKKQAQHNVLLWSTAQEVNTERFEIERSSNGRQYSMVGKTIAGLNAYAFADNNFEKAVNYYRLKMVDRDGRFTYSPVRMVNNSGSFAIYPNPVVNKQLTVYLANNMAGNYTFTLYTTEGRLLLSQQLELNSTIIHLPATISRGTYIAKVLSASQNVLQQLVFVE